MGVSRLSSCVALVFAICFVGCRADKHSSGHSETEELELFEKGKGVRLSDQMHQQFAVQTVEVTEKPIPHRIQRVAQVYRAGRTTEPAAAVVFLSEGEAAQLREGQAVSLAASEPAAAVELGVVKAVNTRVTSVLGQAEVLIEFADPESKWPVGSMVNITINGPPRPPVLAIPEPAVIQGAAGPFVYVINGEHFTRTEVKVGASSEGWIEVTDGLYAGDVVVARGADLMWMIELCALKGGSPCCPVPLKRER